MKGKAKIATIGIILIVILGGSYVFFNVPLVQTNSVNAYGVGQASKSVSLSCVVFHFGMVHEQGSLFGASASTQQWSNNC